jgi:hypothetical protein
MGIGSFPFKIKVHAGSKHQGVIAATLLNLMNSGGAAFFTVNKSKRGRIKGDVKGDAGSKTTYNNEK